MFIEIIYIEKNTYFSCRLANVRLSQAHVHIFPIIVARQSKSNSCNSITVLGVM